MKQGTATQDLYGFKFLFLEGSRSETDKIHKKLKRFFKDSGVSVPDESGHAYCYYQDFSLKIAILVFENSCLANYAGCVSHEALHAAQHVFRIINANWSTEIGEHEPQCYLIQWIVRNFYLAINP